MYDNKVVAKQNRRGEAFRARFNNLDMIQIKYKKITMKIFLVVIFLIMLLPNLTYANTYINNVYNAGTLTSANQSESRGIVYDNPYSNSGYTTTINNSYYLNTAPAGSNDYESYTTAMSASDMKSNKLVNQLNTNKSSINLASISSDLADYSLSSWKLGKDKNPTFDW